MKNKKIKEDIFAYGVMLAVSLTAIFYIIPTWITVPKAATGFFTPRTYPYMCFAVIAICSFIGYFRSIMKYVLEKRKDPNFMKDVKTWKNMDKKERIGVLMPWICALMCIAYALLFSNLGFIPATIIVAPAILLVVGDKKPMHFVYVYAFCAVMYVIFKFVLGVRLP